MSKKEDIEFLQAYLKSLQHGYITLEDLSKADLTKTDELPTTSPDAERAARLADDNGFEGSLFRYLIPSDVPSIRQLRRRLKKQVETIPRIIAKIEKSEEEGQKISLTDNELQLLYDMASQKNQCRHRAAIYATTKIAESTLKTILKDFEKKGWIYRPKGLRSGYTITVAGIQIYEIISAD